MHNLMNVDDAIARILAQIKQLPAETVHLTESLGRVLADDIVSDINLPPFDNSAMDGFAVKAVDSQGASKDAPTRLHVVMDIPAGYAPRKTLETGQAARIMTGAPIPEGADAVIPVEDTDADFSALGDGKLPETVALYKAVGKGASIRKIGENIRIGDTILTKGTAIGAAEIGMLASLGQAEISVIRQPRVAIIGSGNELVGIDEELEAGKIRDSNSYALQALVKQDGGIPLKQAIARDTPEALRELFRNTLADAPDLIISSAGVSVGAADYVRAILEELGDIGFWRINIRPGKPLAFGHIDSIPFFGLPGNPVSAMVTYIILVRPALMALAGKEDRPKTLSVRVGEPMKSDGRRTFARVKLVQEGETLVAYETGTQSSGAHMSMVLADALLIIPENVTSVDAGARLEALLLR